MCVNMLASATATAAAELNLSVSKPAAQTASVDWPSFLARADPVWSEAPDEWCVVCADACRPYAGRMLALHWSHDVWSE